MLFRGFLRRGVVVVFLVDEIEGRMLVVVVFMCVTSVLVCCRILPRFCSDELFTFLFLSIFQKYTTTHCRMASIIIIMIHLPVRFIPIYMYDEY